MSEFVASATGFAVPHGADGLVRAEAARFPQQAAPDDRVRVCTPSDLRQVSMLFQHVFRQSGREPSQELVAHLEDLYFRHPWRDDALPSLVLERADGTLDGFIGILPLRLEFRGRPILGSVAGAFMVRDPEARPLAAARLMRAHVSGSQHVSFGDTTNSPARAMWEKLGGHMLPMASMEWLKVIRWAPFGASSALIRLPRFAAAVLSPIAFAVDRISWALRRRTKIQSELPSETVDDDTYLKAADEVSRRLDFHLIRDPAAGRWMLTLAAQKRKYGPLHRRVVRSRGGKPIGCYLVYGRHGMPGEVLQVVAARRDSKAILDDLFAFARAEGFTAVRGRTQGPLMDALFRAGCLMRHRSSTVYRTADPDLKTALESGAIGLGGFYGETWTRLVSDEFDSPLTFGGHA